MKSVRNPNQMRIYVDIFFGLSFQAGDTYGKIFSKNANVLFESLVFEVLSGCKLRI